MIASPIAPTLSAADLAPGPGLVRDGDRWEADAAQVRLAADAQFAPGWYQVRVAIRSNGRFTIHKRADLTFDSADSNPRPPARETFTWNRLFDERFMLRLTRPSTGVRLDLQRCEGQFTVDAFEVRPVPSRETLFHAIREKWRLIRAYRCTRHVMYRAGRLLLTGRFKQFQAKLLKGLVDARQMRFGPGRAEEVDAAWWRRHALTADEAGEVARACDAMVDPPPIAVLVPLDGARLDQARMSAHSVRRQIYPHWELLLAAVGPSGMQPHMHAIIGPDSRVRLIRVPRLMGLASAVGKAIGETPCEHVVVLPPGVELGEHALYHFAEMVKANPNYGRVGGKVYEGWDEAAGPGRTADTLKQQAEDGDEPDEDEFPVPAAVWMTPTKTLANEVPRRLRLKGVAEWSTGLAAEGDSTVLDSVLAYPIDDRPLIDRARVGRKPTPDRTRLFLAGHLAGISGYDHLVFALIKGLPSVGYDLRLHPHGGIRPDLIPPKLMPSREGWERGALELHVCPPWVAHRSKPGPRSAIYTMWECDRLEQSWVDTFNRSRVVIVPSQWSANCFRACGVTVPIEVAPLGFDPLVFHPGAAKFPTVCTFGTAGALAAGGMRKNTQRIIDLFREAFPTEDVRLRVKITPNSPSVETYDDPRVDVIRSVLPHGELADWYRSLTVYVNASAAEGFGLHLIESMACGRTLISPHYSGLTAFFEPELGYSVDYKMVPVRNDIYSGNWADPDDASLIARMRQVYADQPTAERLGKAAAARATGFTWKAGGRALAAALRKHGFLS